MLKPKVAMESDKCKVLRDFKVQTNHEINERRPDFNGVQKDKNICQITDFAYPYEGRVDTKELEKKHYQDFARDLRKTWNMIFRVIPLVICALETTSKKLKS